MFNDIIDIVEECAIYCETNCCALGEFYGLELREFTSSALPALMYYVSALEHNNDSIYKAVARHIVVTAATPEQERKLRNLRAYIYRHKLGAMVATKPELNPNSGSFVVAAFWTVDDVGLQEWAENGAGKRLFERYIKERDESGWHHTINW